MDCYYCSIVGSSRVNGDKAFLSEDKRVFAISDGASGAYDKVKASTLCIKPLERLGYKNSSLSPLEYINYCFQEANDNLINKSKVDGKLSFGTMTICVLDKRVLSTGMVGDTPAFLIRGNEIVRLCSPKKTYDRAIECGVLNEEEAKKAIETLPGPMRSNFEVFLPMIIPSIAKSQIEVSTDDILFICCDGITDWISEEELVDFFKEEESLEKTCDNIIEKIDNRCPKEHLDDRTMIAVKFQF